MNVLSGQSSEIVTPEKLDDTRRKLVERYVKVSGVRGVLVGTLVDGKPWNVRGLLLDGGVLKVLRFTDPGLVDDRERYALIGTNIRKISVLTEKYHVWAAGEHDGQFWSLRNYFQTTLAEVPDLSEGNSPVTPAVFAGELVQIVNDWSRDGVVHGHLCPANISIENGIPVVLDFGFCAASRELIVSTTTVAPEVKAGEPPSAASDIFGLGLVLQYVLRHDLSSAQSSLVAQMLEDKPENRPLIQDILPVFLNARRTGAIVKNSSNGDVAEKPAFQVQERRSAEETLQWAKGTVSLSPDIINKIKSTIVNDATPAQMEHLTRVLSKRTGTDDQTVIEPVSSVTTTRATKSAPVEKTSAPPAELPVVADQSAAPEKSAESTDGYWVLGGIIAAGIALLLYLGYFPSLTGEAVPYDRYWKSGLPSRMRAVALAAVEDRDVVAELVIVEDTLSGTDHPQVLSSFLRTAFNSAWEKELSSADRELALKIGLSKLVPELLKGEPDLSDAHPGVILAVMGTLRLDDPAGMLKEVSTIRLARLPQPYGTSFNRLQELGYTYADNTAVRAMAYLLNGSVSRQVLQAYFSPEDSIEQSYGKFRYLYSMVGKSKEARNTLQSVLQNQSGKLTSLFNWFNESSIADWSKIDDEKRLQLIGGDLGAVNLEVEQIADLMTFPVKAIAEEAATLLGTRLNREELLSLAFLVSDRNPFPRAQTSFLATALVLKGEEQYPMLSRWFDTGPNAEGVIQLILTRAEIAELDPLSIEGARYLTARNWQVSKKILTRLLTHPEPMVRVLALSRLDPEDPLDKKLLETAVGIEPNARLREQIELKLGMEKPVAENPAETDSSEKAAAGDAEGEKKAEEAAAEE